MRVPVFLKKIIVGMWIAVGVAASSAAIATETVVDYYRQLQQQMGEDAFPYTLHKKADKWDVSVPDNFIANIAKLIVDEKNGYIYINDEGTGGGNGETQFALFRGEGDSPYIVWVESSFMGSQPDESHPHLYAHDGDKWYSRDEWAFGIPKLAFSDFLPDTMSVADANALAKLSPNYASIYYKMPRYGTTAEAWFSVRDSEYEPLCNSSHTGERNAAAIKHYCTKLKGKIYYKIDINWNKQQSRFDVGNKHNEIPNWESIW